jgi:CubicO group peptidase (beta-lactamase class C family)
MADSLTVPSALTPQMKSHVDATMNAALIRQGVPGASLAIALNGRVVYARGYGVQDLSSKTEASIQTIYPIGSNTKQFTAAAILLLQQRGQLALDDPLSKYVPEAPHANDITLAQLLGQVSGLLDYTQTPEFGKNSSRSTTPRAMLATIRDLPLSFKPGTSWQYSNTNYLLLSMVIAKASGEPYQTFVRNEILESANLHTAAFESNSQTAPHEALGYSSFAMGTAHEAAPTDYSWFQGTGDLMMSAADLAQWDIALDSGAVISPESFEKMSTPKTLPDGTSTGYGYGLGAGNSFIGHAIVGHLGGFSGFISEDITIPSDHVAVVLLSNSDTFNPVPIAHDIIAAIYAQPLPHSPSKALPHSEIEEQQARAWLERALGGRINATNADPDFMSWIMPSAAAQASVTADLRALGDRLGAPISFQLVSRDSPPGVQSFEYHVTFPRDVVDFQYAVTSSGKLDYLAFAPAYDY